MFRQALLLITALVLSGFAGFWLARMDTLPVPQQKTAQEDKLARLQHTLAESEHARIRLQERITFLGQQLAERAETKDPEADVPGGDPVDTAAAETVTGIRTYRTSIDTLIEAGLPKPVAADIQARLDAWELEWLDLRDRAKREGWMNTARYRKQARKLQEAYRTLRPEVGDAVYDRLLYALGHANRVMVRDVIQYSFAEQAGLQPGDRIIEYAGTRVFTPPELNALTATGRAGSQVLIRVERDGELLDVYVPRGPLGIRMAPDRAGLIRPQHDTAAIADW